MTGWNLAGLLLYTLGYTESFAEELRQADPAISLFSLDSA